MAAVSKSTTSAVILIRILVGWVFVSEGIQKFLFREALGWGRFERIGIPHPHLIAPMVAVVEIVCGLLILLGPWTRQATLPLLIDISLAIIFTKIPILLGRNLWHFIAPKPPYGLWPMPHEGRVDFSMLLGLIFLLIVGPGSWSLDR